MVQRLRLVACAALGLISSGVAGAAPPAQTHMEAPLDFSITSSSTSSDVDTRNAGSGAAAAEFGSSDSVKSTSPEVISFGSASPRWHTAAALACERCTRRCMRASPAELGFAQASSPLDFPLHRRSRL